MYDLVKVLDDTYDKSALRFRVAQVVAANPLTILYDSGSNPQPASRLGSYTPVVGHVVYVLQRGKGQSVVLGQVFSSTDQGGTAPPNPDGNWTANLLTNGGFEYGFTGWEQSWWDITKGFRLTSPGFDNTPYAALGIPYQNEGGTWSNVQLQQSLAYRQAVTPGAVYRVDAKIRLTKFNTVWMGLALGTAPDNVSTGALGQWWGGWQYGSGSTIQHPQWDVVVPAGMTYGMVWIQAVDYPNDGPFDTSWSATIDSIRLRRKL